MKILNPKIVVLCHTKGPVSSLATIYLRLPLWCVTQKDRFVKGVMTDMRYMGGLEGVLITSEPWRIQEALWDAGIECDPLKTSKPKELAKGHWHLPGIPRPYWNRSDVKHAAWGYLDDPWLPRDYPTLVSKGFSLHVSGKKELAKHVAYAETNESQVERILTTKKNGMLYGYSTLYELLGDGYKPKNYQEWETRK